MIESQKQDVSKVPTFLQGEVVALVGESGSGKSTLAKIILGLQKPDSGDVLIDGKSIGSFSSADVRKTMLRVQPVFQDSSAAFNPRRNVRSSLLQADRIRGLPASNAETRLTEVLEQVGLSPAKSYLDRLPHQVSGGQRQRLAIARALAANPDVIVADEPLSGADVSIRGQVLNLLTDLRLSKDIAIIFITHDISIAREFSNRVYVMYKGGIVEHGKADIILNNPSHAYTRRLLDAAPKIPESGIRA